MNRYDPHGLLGLGFTALMASFMSGMAGNVTAFNTVCTYDLYQTYLAKGPDDWHYLRVGKLATVVGTALSIGSAYSLLLFDNLMDYMQSIGAMTLRNVRSRLDNAGQMVLACAVAGVYLPLNVWFR